MMAKRNRRQANSKKKKEAPLREMHESYVLDIKPPTEDEESTEVSEAPEMTEHDDHDGHDEAEASRGGDVRSEAADGPAAESNAEPTHEQAERPDTRSDARQDEDRNNSDEAKRATTISKKEKRERIRASVAQPSRPDPATTQEPKRRQPRKGEATRDVQIVQQMDFRLPRSAQSKLAWQTDPFAMAFISPVANTPLDDRFKNYPTWLAQFCVAEDTYAQSACIQLTGGDEDSLSSPSDFTTELASAIETLFETEPQPKKHEVAYRIDSEHIVIEHDDENDEVSTTIEVSDLNAWLFYEISLRQWLIIYEFSITADKKRLATLLETSRELHSGNALNDLVRGLFTVSSDPATGHGAVNDAPQTQAHAQTHSAIRAIQAAAKTKAAELCKQLYATKKNDAGITSDLFIIPANRTNASFFDARSIPLLFHDMLMRAYLDRMSHAMRQLEHEVLAGGNTKAKSHENALNTAYICALINSIEYASLENETFKRNLEQEGAATNSRIDDRWNIERSLERMRDFTKSLSVYLEHSTKKPPKRTGRKVAITILVLVTIAALAAIGIQAFTASDAGFAGGLFSGELFEGGFALPSELLEFDLIGAIQENEALAALMANIETLGIFGALIPLAALLIIVVAIACIVRLFRK